MKVFILAASLTTTTVAGLAAQAPRASSVQVSIARTKESTPQRTVLLVRVDAKGVTLGSYEGHLRFDPAAFAVDSATVNSDGSRFVNAAGAPKGEVRFAGFTTSGFKTADALRIVGHTGRPIDAAKLAATLAVAGDIDGNKVRVVNSTRIDTEK